jgi:hypothetical protein
MTTLKLTTWKVVDAKDGTILGDGFITENRAIKLVERLRVKGIAAILEKVPA